MRLFLALVSIAVTHASALAAIPLHESNPVALRALEKRGWAFSEVLCGRPTGTTRELARGCAAYKSLAGVLKGDIAERATKAQLLHKDTELEVFRSGWLEATNTEFYLTGVIARWDRMPVVEH